MLPGLAVAAKVLQCNDDPLVPITYGFFIVFGILGNLAFPQLDCLFLFKQFALSDKRVFSPDFIVCSVP